MQRLKQHCVGSCSAPRSFVARRVVRSARPGTSTRQAVSLDNATVNKEQKKNHFFYDGVVFDMDGTLTQAHIDFADMRARTNIPKGDLFTVMEAWKEDSEILRAMTIILDIEAEAAKGVSMMPGLLPLLDMLRERKIRVALVTRNTTASVDAFFNLVGPEWRGMFSIVLTREFQYVKPDKRLLIHVAEEWGVEPARLLMVGDSFEDVEVGNAAGTATCWIAGGGNEKPGANVSPPAGAVATFNVNSLDELRERLEAGADQSDSKWEQPMQLGWPARQLSGPQGAPPPGLAFLDWLNEVGALLPGGCSFPVMGRAAGGLATTEDMGDKVLHLMCSTGGLTKMIASQGMQVIGMDPDVTAAETRGLTALHFDGLHVMSRGSLKHVQEHAPFDVVLIQGHALPSTEGLVEIQSILCNKGKLCCEMALTEGSLNQNPAAIINHIHMSGMSVVNWKAVEQQDGGRLIRLVAKMSNLN